MLKSNHIILFWFKHTSKPYVPPDRIYFRGFILNKGMFPVMRDSLTRKTNIYHHLSLNTHEGILQNNSYTLRNSYKLHQCDLTPRDWLFGTFGNRFSFTQSPCGGTCCYVDVYCLTFFPRRKFAQSYLIHSCQYLYLSLKIFTSLYSCTSTSHVLVPVTSHCSPF